MPAPNDLLTLTDAAEHFGVDVRVVRGLVRLLGIDPKPVPRNGNAKGLDPADIRRIQAAIRAGSRRGPGRPPKVTT